MKNLLSKIGKALLIPALALSLGVQKSSAQSDNPVKDNPKIDFSSDISAGGYLANHPKMEIYDNWKNHFSNLSGDEKLDYNKYGLCMDISFNMDLGVKTKKASFGLSSKIHPIAFITNFPVSDITLNNWRFDYVRPVNIEKSEKLPFVGAFLKFPLEDDKELIFRNYLGKIKIIEEYREDKDLKSRLKCESPVDATKDLTRVFRKEECNTIVNEFSIGYLTNNYDTKCGWELYYKTDFNKLHELGLNATWYLF